MRLLLDTDALIWSLADPGKLSDYAARAIENRSNDVLVSVVSVWEIGVKRAKGKLHMQGSLEEAILEKEFRPLPLGLDHALAVEALPHQHHDPFDRMLIAQAQIEGLTMVTSDREMRHYPISVLSAI